MNDRAFHVLFLCTQNSARSIIAESIMNFYGKNRFVAYSAGNDPQSAVNPRTLNLLTRLNYPTEGLRPKGCDTFSRTDAPDMDFVFTVGDQSADEICPSWPGHPMKAHWGVPDPEETTGREAEIAQAFNDTHRMLHNRVSIFINLPVTSLDKLSLQKKLDEIGKN